MKLIGKRILCKKIEVENKTASGLILPKKSENDFEVVAIGSRVEMVKVGDRVRKFKNSAGVSIEYKGDNLLVLSEDGDLELILNQRLTKV